MLQKLQDQIVFKFRFCYYWPWLTISICFTYIHSSYFNTDHSSSIYIISGFYSYPWSLICESIHWEIPFWPLQRSYIIYYTVAVFFFLEWFYFFFLEYWSARGIYYHLLAKGYLSLSLDLNLEVYKWSYHQQQLHYQQQHHQQHHLSLDDFFSGSDTTPSTWSTEALKGSITIYYSRTSHHYLWLWIWSCRRGVIINNNNNIFGVVLDDFLHHHGAS